LTHWAGARATWSRGSHLASVNPNERREEAADRRAKTIGLTALGRSTVEPVEAVSNQIRHAALAGLTDDEIATATRIL
jgi:MarR family transcriptional regulator for hemolysin